MLVSSDGQTTQPVYNNLIFEENVSQLVYDRFVKLIRLLKAFDVV